MEFLLVASELAQQAWRDYRRRGRHRRHLRADARDVGRGLAPIELEGLAPAGAGAELDGEGFAPVDRPITAGADRQWGRSPLGPITAGAYRHWSRTSAAALGRTFLPPLR